jgi:hypothetical protein
LLDPMPKPGLRKGGGAVDGQECPLPVYSSYN